jgi:hypothetical protein
MELKLSDNACKVLGSLRLTAIMEGHLSHYIPNCEEGRRIARELKSAGLFEEVRKSRWDRFMGYLGKPTKAYCLVSN